MQEHLPLLELRPGMVRTEAGSPQPKQVNKDLWQWTNSRTGEVYSYIPSVGRLWVENGYRGLKDLSDELASARRWGWFWRVSVFALLGLITFWPGGTIHLGQWIGTLIGTVVDVLAQWVNHYQQ